MTAMQKLVTQPDGSQLYVDFTDAETSQYAADIAAEAAKAVPRILAALAAHRYSVQTGGFAVGGSVFRTDPDSQVALMGAMIIASANPAYTVNWKTPSGFVTLNATQVIAAANGVAAFIQKCFDTEATLIAVVGQYGDKASIVAAFDATMAG